MDRPETILNRFNINALMKLYSVKPSEEHDLPVPPIPVMPSMPPLMLAPEQANMDMEMYSYTQCHQSLTESDFLNPEFSEHELTVLTTSSEFREEGDIITDAASNNYTICSSYPYISASPPPLSILNYEDNLDTIPRLYIKEEDTAFEQGCYMNGDNESLISDVWTVGSTVSINNDSSCSNDDCEDSDYYDAARTADVFNIPCPQRTNIPNTCSESESDSSEVQENKPARKKPGRKKGQVSRVLHLWEFIRDLLKDPNYTGRIIKWEDKSHGVFRIVKSTEVAKLWGEKKKNKRSMTYEKMSRSLRYSRKEGYFGTVPKERKFPKKLCFKFGPKSKGWQN